MDLNVSDTSFAYSDTVGPSHVSGLESFSDFDASEYSESFEDQEAHDSGVEEESVTPHNLESSQNENKDARPERLVFLLVLQAGSVTNYLNLPPRSMYFNNVLYLCFGPLNLFIFPFKTTRDFPSDAYLNRLSSCRFCCLSKETIGKCKVR